MRSIYFLIGIVLLSSAFAPQLQAQDQPAKPAGNSAAKKKQDDQPAKGNPQDSKTKKKSESKQGSPMNQDSSTNQSSSTTSQSPQQAAAAAALAAYLSAPRRQRLGRTPRMFGDWFRPGISIVSVSETAGPTNGIFTQVSIPQTSRVGKISENNSALPFDRFFVNYSYFHNAIRGTAIGPDFQSTTNAPSIERYTIGMEKTFLDGMTSLEARFVMSDVPDFQHNPVGPGPLGYQTFSPTMGNLTLVGKMLLAENDSTALAAGLGVELPTGGDSFVQSGPTLLELENQTVYLSPYIGLAKKPTDSPWFANAFVQVEFPLWGDEIRGIDPSTGTTTAFGRHTSQTTLFVDVAIGRWLYQQQGGLVTGVAGFIEGHYNAALNDSDLLSDSFSNGSLSSSYTLNPVNSRFNIVDLTAGLHFEIANRTKLRIAGVIPVSGEKSFDSEIGIQLSRHR